ncbi:MAG: ATP-dependent helicase [Campylobacteraceae bacterium]|jgi:DNA helicase-2/ATP-dependent DNA helicase PcrA|nr:ATP-dependent helicase [Campylobacteraceae bacterium]MBT3882210.1 ATP-dependent helicase [Campylobacteraceae bacterium]MBT4030636.1 ATP-dependent helicase [Campylobacteraceae bacterium]MBT4178784.1 ATP-dependent helicase [Campylobacteraceae bacterium]MBT4571951.1 ATP-dependent helicase [Campylobacteraceae bacterium]
MPLKNLNTEQLNSATCQNGNNLIIASAGTGKTSTIVGRIAHLLNTGSKPENILLLTFTNKAAAEMIARVAKYFGETTAKAIMSGTFHSVSYKLLKQLNIKITLKSPRELKTLFKSIYEKRVFPEFDEKSPPYDGNYLYDLYSLFLNSTYDENFEQWIGNKNEDQKKYTLIYQDVIDEFDKLKLQYGYVNFDDLLLLMIKELSKHNFTFDEILVDEYQDTNPLQGKLLNAFKSNSLFCVGDYDQSIYAFNGSDIGIISSFATRYENTKVFTLNKNYRSTAPILSLATKVIKNNDRLYEKKLEVVRTEPNYNPKLLTFSELYDQYDYIAHNILKTQTPHEEIAIIYRNNSTADGIEANLRDLGIKSKRKGGHSFFDAREVKAILDMIVLMVNHNDMMAFIHLIEYGKNIGKAIAKEIFDALIKLGHGSLIDGLMYPDEEIKNPYKSDKIKNVQLGLFDDFIELGSVGRFKPLGFDEDFLSNPILKHPKLSLDSASFLFQFYKIIKELKRIKNPKSMISHIQKHQFFKDICDSICTLRAKQKDGSINEEIKKTALFKVTRKVEILKHLSTHHTNLQKFINAMILGGGELSEGEGVNLLSIHASKGLEFKEVYVIDLMDGRFPNRTLMSKGGSLEEERRLFYVAVTRAKDILYLSYAKYDKIKKMDFIHSPFLEEAGLVGKTKEAGK